MAAPQATPGGVTTVTSTTTVTAGDGVFNPSDIVIAHSFMDRDEPNFLQWNSAIRDYATQKGATFEELVFAGDAEVMMNQLDQLVLKYDPEKVCLTSWPGDEAGFRSVSDWAEANHVYTGFWYCTPIDFPFEDYHYVVSASHDDSVFNGYYTTMRMIEQLETVDGLDPSEMNFVWVGAGIFGWCWPLRVAGFLQACEEKGVNVVGGNFTGWTRETSYELTTTLIAKYGADKINGGFSVFNGPGLGIMEAFRDAGIVAPVATIGVIQEVADEIIAGAADYADDGDYDQAYMLCACGTPTRFNGMSSGHRVYSARMGTWYPSTEEKHWAYVMDLIDPSNAERFYNEMYGYPKPDYQVDEYLWGQPAWYNQLPHVVNGQTYTGQFGIPGYLPAPTEADLQLLQDYTEEF